MKSLKLTLISTVGIFLLTNCSSGSGGDGKSPTGKSDTTLSTEDLGYNPHERWPEKGEFSYNFSYTFNGVKCEANKSFNSQADYCLGLQDQSLNSNCALEMRESTYKSNCGDDFQEINFKNYFWQSGYDTHLQKNCETGNPRETVFKTEKHYCEFLKDENAHKNCFWQSRKEKFQSRGCQGNFSAMPSSAQPSPSPNPQPAPSPSPTPTPSQPEDLVAIVQELRAQGFILKVNWKAIRQVSWHPRPGEPSINQKMQLFWSELAANKNHILKRKNEIKEIEVSIYTQHSFNHGGALILDFETKQGELKEYFPLLDQALSTSRELGIVFEFIHSGNAEDTTSYLPLRQILKLVQQHKVNLHNSKGMIKKIDTESYSSYNANDRSLTLDRKQLASEFAKYIQLLKPLAPVFLWSDTNNIQLDLNSDFDLEKNRDKVYTAFALLESALKELNQIAQAGMIKELSLWFSQSKPAYYNSLKKLTLGIVEANKVEVKNTLQGLARVAHLSQELQKPIELGSYNLDESFFTELNMLEALWPKIKAKATKISVIHLGGYTSTYYKSTQELIIGYKSTLEETAKVVAEIARN